jgi:AcrR family transcriptional regulator
VGRTSVQRQVASDSLRRDDIVEVAADLFFQHGYASTSMQNIADASGLHKSSLYHHVEGKAELLNAICGRTLDALFASLESAVEARTDAGERVVTAFAGAASVALDDIRGINILLDLKQDVDGGERLWERRREYDRRFSDLIRRAQHKGEVRDDIDALLLGRLVLGMINWVVEWYRAGEGPYRPQDIVRSLTAFMRQGVLPPPRMLAR